MTRHRLFFLSISFFFAFAWAPFLYADGLVNINTADKATLDTLTGIGDVKAQAIIDYRTQHGPFATIEDIMNVSGIGTATFNNIKNSITVGDSSSQTQTNTASQTTLQTQTSTSTQTQTQNQTNQISGMNVPTLSAKITASATSMVGGGSFFSAAAYTPDGNAAEGARYLWNFGDGATAEGQTAFHTYTYPGKYAVYVTVASGIMGGTARAIITAIPAQLALLAEPDGSLVLEDESPQELDVGLWSITFGTSTFVIPKNTVVLGNEAVRFAPAVLGFAAAPGALLQYPNSAVAATAAGGVPDEAMAPAAVQHATNALVSTAKISAASAAHINVAKVTNTVPPIPTTTATDLAAAVGESGASFPWWSIGIGVVALVGLGVAGMWYVRAGVPVTPLAETEAEVDEFEIDD